MIRFSIKAIKRDPESIMTDVIVNIGGDSIDETNLIAKFGKSDNNPMSLGVHESKPDEVRGYELQMRLRTSSAISGTSKAGCKQRKEANGSNEQIIT